MSPPTWRRDATPVANRAIAPAAGRATVPHTGRASVPAGGAPSAPAADRESTSGAARRTAGPDWALAVGLVAVLTGALAIIDPRLRHWFVVPVAACGMLIGVDAVRWARRRLDIFDPQALLGLLGVHFFYLAPILHVLLDYWPPRMLPPADWRTALGMMALLNALGLLVYRWLMTPQEARRVRTPGNVRFDERRFLRVGAVVVAVGFVAFCVEVVMFGGVSGFFDLMTQRRDVLAGTSWLLIPAESFPLILFALVLVRWRTVLTRKPFVAVALLVGLAVLQFMVGGLRGSRSSTVWPILIGLMLIHLLIFRISRKALVACGALFIAFMYLYGLYKTAGVEVVEVARGARTVQAVSQETGRDMPTMVLGDLARADIQALVLDRERNGAGQLGYGVTYLGGVAALLPQWLVPGQFPSKLTVGTEVLYGPGVYDFYLHRWSTRVYGLTGEAMLNFGPIAAVVAFLPFGFVVRRARGLYQRARDEADLARKLLVPALVIAAVLILSSDLDNLAYFLVQRFLPIAVVVLLALRPSHPPTGGARTVRPPGFAPGSVVAVGK